MRNILRLFEQRLLLEADDYKPMFEPLHRALQAAREANPALDTHPIDTWVERAERYVAPQRKDKQMWVSRVARAYLALATSYFLINNDMAEAAAAVHEMADKYASQIGGLMRVGSSSPSAIVCLSGLRQFIDAMEHYDGVNYGKIKNFSYNSRMTEEQVFDTLRQHEEDYIERAKGCIALEPGDQIILKMPPYYWVLLNRASCPIEAKAMGHCGNSPAAQTQQRIISLRLLKDEIEGVQYFEPCLTFILLEDGFLGEMKGKGNLKPAEHYHDQIEALLHLPIIKGIRGGGYLPQNNFALEDFGEERHLANAQKKPELLPLKQQYDKLGFTPRFEELLVQGFNALGRDFWRKNNFNPDMMHPEDKEKLFRDNPILMPVKDYYARLGLDDQLAKLLGNRFDWSQSDRARHQFEREEHFFLVDLKDEDRERLFKAYPGVMTCREYYDRLGLNDTLMNRIASGIEDYTSYSDPQGQGWYNRHGTESEGFSAQYMSEEDRHRLWRTHPETATIMDAYEMDGLTDDLIARVEEGYDQSGWEYLRDVGFVPKDLKPEDQAKLINTDFVPAATAFKVGSPERFHAVCEKACADKAESGVGFEVKWDDGQNLFRVQSFPNTFELTDEYGDSSLKSYGDEEDPVEYYTDHIDEDSHGVQNFDDYLSIDVQKLLYAKAREYAADEYDPEDEDYDEDHGVESWSDVIRVLHDNGDDNVDEMIRGVQDGEAHGAENEASEAVLRSLERIELTHGSMKFSYYHNKQDNKDYIARDQPCWWVMTSEEMIKFVDGDAITDAQYGDLKDVLKDEEISMTVPHYGFSGFDEDVAVEYFLENCDLDLDELTPNPYTADKRAKMSADQLRDAINEVYDLCQGVKIYRPRDLDTLSDDKLREKLAYVCQKYYYKKGDK